MSGDPAIEDFDEKALVETLADQLNTMPVGLDTVDRLALVIGAAMRAAGVGPGEAAQACCRITENLGGRPARHIVYQPDGGWLDISPYSVERIVPAEGDEAPPETKH